jgi:hypothetical protein
MKSSPDDLSAVAIFVYNRPEFVTRLIASLRMSQPQRLLIISDGPKEGDARDAERVREVRAAIQLIDWQCEVKRNYSDKNLGLRNRISTGLDWAFSLYSKVTILEDDCIPSKDFLRFTEEMLDEFGSDYRVFRIGSRLVWDSRDSNYSFNYVSRPGIWGWASWSRVWCEFREWDQITEITVWHVMRDILRTRGYFNKLVRMRLLSKKRNWSQWGVRFSIFCSEMGGVGISPRCDLVENVGFTPDATHTKRNILRGFQIEKLDWPLIYPEKSRVSVRKNDIDGSRQEFRGFFRQILKVRKGRV